MYYFLKDAVGKIFANVSSETDLEMAAAQTIPARTEADGTLGAYERWELRIVDGAPKWTRQPRALTPADLLGENAKSTVEAMQALPSAVYVAKQSLLGKAIESDDQKLRASGLYEPWCEGSYAVGDIRNAGNQTWECFQAHDNAVYPDIRPDNLAWFTFWRPLHGTSPETARAFVPVQGSHDIYKVGEYMIWTDGKCYRCVQDTNFSPEEFAPAWEVYDGGVL